MNKKTTAVGATKSTIILILSAVIVILCINFQKEKQNLEAELEQCRFIIEDNRNTYNECWEMMNEREMDLVLENHNLKNDLRELTGMTPTVLGYNLSEYEFDLLCRCAQAEAGYGNLCSQRHVVNVILNRVMSDDFPNTISGVINEHNGDFYQFSVVKDGRINEEATEETIKNVAEALLFNEFELPSEVIYFYATGTRANCTTYFECEGTTYGY